MKRILAPVAAAILASLGGATPLHGIARADGGTPVTCGSEITTPGQYYLANDCTGPGINISSSNVHLKLNGHTMNGDYGVSDIGIQVYDVTNVQIEGPGTITQYDGAVYFGDVTNSHVWKVVGVFHPYAAAMFEIARGSSGNIFNNDTSVGGEIGFWIVKSNNNNLVNDEAEGTNYEGINLSMSSDNNISSSASHNNDYAGIEVYDSSGNTITGTDASSNGSYGIKLDVGSSNDRVNGDTAYGNAVFDLEDDNPNCDSNIWKGNRFGTTNQPQCVS